MLIKRNYIAARNFRQGFIDERFRPSQIVVFLGGALGNPFVNKPSRRVLDRREVATRDMDFAPCFLFRRQCNGHKPSYHGSD